MSTTTDWKQHVTSVDTVVLAMPPSAHEELLAELSPLISNQLVVTVAAGIGPSYLEARLPKARLLLGLCLIQLLKLESLSPYIQWDNQ